MQKSPKSSKSQREQSVPGSFTPTANCKTPSMSLTKTNNALMTRKDTL